jgi:aspartyl-tRNA synthetase
MKTVYTKDLLRIGIDGNRYRICGWIDRIRDLGRVKFAILRDREGSIQIVGKAGEVSQEVLEITSDQTVS